MNVLRGALLAASQNVWLRERAMRSRPVRRAVARFMPGESLEDALAAAGVLRRSIRGGETHHLTRLVGRAFFPLREARRRMAELRPLSALEIPS